MEWFHFTDFHIGKPREPQSTALVSLLESIQLACRCGSGKIDAVFITGDIAYSGKAEEYEKFATEFLLPLKKIDAFADSVIFAVPGNHDVDCDSILPHAWEKIGDRNQKIFFNEDLNGVRVRKSRAVVFDAYRDFINQYKIVSPDPAKEVTLLYQQEAFPFDVLATNTAFFSDKEQNSSGEVTPAPTESLRQVLAGRAKPKPVIILAHHPVTCFLKQDQKQFGSLLRDKKAVLIHGHEHEPRVKFNRDGTIQTLGFGACYLAGLQGQTVAPYFNTYTHCILESDLKLRSFSWQPEPGKWVDSTALQLPETLAENILDHGPGRVDFPTLEDLVRSKQSTVPLRSVQRSSPKPTKTIPIEILGDKVWYRLFNVSKNLRSIFQKGEPNTRIISKEEGKLWIELERDNGQRDLLLFIWAVNHILSSKEIETLNTDLDTEGFASVTVLSIGKISTDAYSMYLRLQTRKPIEVLVNEGITAEADRLLTEQQRLVLAGLDAGTHTVCLLMGEEDVYLLLIEERQGQRQFSIVQGRGGALAATDSVVASLRKCDPDFADMAYIGESANDSSIGDVPFNENDYLRQCHGQYNIMKYAALANVGIRFADLPLEELYVSATACEVSDKNALRAEQFVGDHLASYQVSEELRDQIQSKLLTTLRHDERQEASQAREFCQKYNAVLVTGDPGSGKTCFVKSEILGYCKRGLDEQSQAHNGSIDWHSNHVPVMVPLSEMVAEKDLEDSGLFVVTSRLLERRGLLFPEKEIRRLALKGRIAFFFDGLDEVVSIEKRAHVVKLINDLVQEYLQTGNRFVVTSRPAAVQVVNLLPTLQKLELQGLSESEITTLAKRLLALKLAATPSDVLVGEGSLNEHDHIVISQLINDCSKNPGVARMAQNPLLLTLLIMIYANSGAPSAKRHLIYEEAIKTLASVRGREAGHQPISVQDLRERLGSIALSVYRRESGLLPFRYEVTEAIRLVMERQRGEAVSSAEANAFLQKVAESTGLIALEARRGEEDCRATVTFMHHSFLEYFAAVGLSRELERTEIGSLVNEPRWREILTLLAGIVGESEDVSPIIKQFLSVANSEPDIDAKILLFAMDCALECEVPSEAAQRLLSNSIKECLCNGPAKFDSWVRSEIGQRLAYLFEVCGPSEFESMLSSLIRTGEESVCAAAIDVVGYAFSETVYSNELLTSFEFACSRTEDAVLSAICIAASRARGLRTHASLQTIASCLTKSRRNQRASYEALARIPSLASKYWSEIINGIEDKSEHISRWASLAAIQAGLNVDVISLNASRKDILLKAINQVDMIGCYDDSRHSEIRKETLNRLLASAHLRDRTLGIRLLPLAEGQEQYVYDMLMEVVRDIHAPREELVAALTALRWSGSALLLIKLADLRTVAEWLKNGTSDVRVASALLLGSFGNDMVAIEALLGADFQKLDIDDYCARIQSLSRAKVALDRVSTLFFEELKARLESRNKMNAEYLRRVKSLLDATRKLGETVSPSLGNRIKSLLDDYKIDISLKKKALLCFPAVAMPSQKTVEIITGLCTRPPFDMDAELVQVPSILAKKCRSSLDYVVSSVNALARLRVALLELHTKFMKRQPSEDNEFYISELRSGITEITQIIVAFKDFIGDVPLKNLAPQDPLLQVD